MRRLIYIPVIHTELEMGSVVLWLREDYILKLASWFIRTGSKLWLRIRN